MGRITPALGFVPSSVTDIMARLRVQLENILGIQYTSDEEFLDSNIYRLFLGFATQLGDLEDSLVQIIDGFISWIRATNNQIGSATSGTYGGITKAFLKSFQGVSIVSKNTQDTLPPGVALVALDNTDGEDNLPDPRLSEEEQNTLAGIFRDYWPIGIMTQANSLSEVKTTESSSPVVFDILSQITDGDTQTYSVTMVELIPLEIEISYRTLNHVIIPSAQEDTLKKAFLENFASYNAIGKDFEPRSYLSTQNISWATDCICKWREAGSKEDYSEEPYLVPEFHKKFVVAKDPTTGLPLVSVKS